MKAGKLTCCLLMLFIAPAFGQDKHQGKKEDAKGDTKSKKEESKPSPIQRLVELNIDQYIVPARMVNIPLPGRTRTLQDVLDQLDSWTRDEKVGAVLMNLGFTGLSMPDIEELRAGIARLRAADKKVLAFINAPVANAYLLACAADEIAMAPTGTMVIQGLGALFPFMKGHYQMLGIEYEVISCGRYKYPGFVNQREPNEYFKEEYNAILDSWFQDYKQMIAQSRGLTDEQVSDAIDQALFGADDALEHKLVDKIAYYDDFREQVLRREKVKRYRHRGRDLSRVNSIQDLMELVNEELKKAEESRHDVGPKIAVLHARGPIIDISLGPGFASQIISRDDFVKVVDQLRKNKSIKAVVLRVDSPGGSAYASDVIWQHMTSLGEEKPLVVSMGTVAGSGGYYIACPGERIFAQPTTITGSIGVLGIFASSWSAFNRMDYELAPMQRGARALLGAPHRTMTKKDRDFFQDYMNQTYDVFIKRVASTRKIPAEEVRKIAEGRIYTGRQALEIGLVDELGGINDAIEAARTLANIPPSAELKIVHYPRPGSLGELFESIGMMGVDTVLEAVSRGMNGVPSMSFDQQLGLFAQTPQALCWMAVPEFYRPSATLGAPWPGGSYQPAFMGPLPGSIWQSRMLVPNR